MTTETLNLNELYEDMVRATNMIEESDDEKFGDLLDECYALVYKLRELLE